MSKKKAIQSELIQKRVRECRLEVFSSREKCSKRIAELGGSLSKETIRDVEKGRRGLTDYAAAMLSKACGVDAEYLLGKSDYKNAFEKMIAHSNNTENVQACLFALLAGIGVEIFDIGHYAISNHGTKLERLSPTDTEYDVRDAHTIYRIVVNGKIQGYIKDNDLSRLSDLMLSTLKTQAETFASSFDIIAESERIEYLEMADRSSKEFLKNNKETPNQTKTKP